VRLRWTATAQADLEAIIDYFLAENPTIAGDIVERIDQAVRPLVDHPGIGRPGRVTGSRELVVSGLPYILPYQVSPDTIIILRVLHSAQRWPTKF